MPDPSSSLATVTSDDGDAEPRQRFSEVLSDLAVRSVAALSPFLRGSEHFLRPRMPALLHPVPERIVGTACLLLAIKVFLPIPSGNILPAFAISVSALGILERDGLAVLIGSLATIGSLLILALISSAIVAGFNAFFAHHWVPV